MSILEWRHLWWGGTGTGTVMGTVVDGVGRHFRSLHQDPVLPSVLEVDLILLLYFYFLALLLLLLGDSLGEETKMMMIIDEKIIFFYFLSINCNNIEVCL